jgi:hypothetical protein
MRDYCVWRSTPTQGDFKGSGLNGYEVALAHLGLPVKNDMDEGILLQAAGETFQFRPALARSSRKSSTTSSSGSTARARSRTSTGMLANSRGTNGVELITKVIDDKAEDYQQTGVIAEGARIPIRSLKTDQKSVTFHKFGGGYEFTYEFERRVSLDVVTPYANRIEREVQIGQVGDRHRPPDQRRRRQRRRGGDQRFGPRGDDHRQRAVAAGRMNWEIFLRGSSPALRQASRSTPSSATTTCTFEWERMFATPTRLQRRPDDGRDPREGGCPDRDREPAVQPARELRGLLGAPASKLVGFIKGETVEELVENGSDIEESVRAIENQKVRYVKTKNHGYRLVFADTRNILNLDAVAAG